MGVDIFDTFRVIGVGVVCYLLRMPFLMRDTVRFRFGDCFSVLRVKKLCGDLGKRTGVILRGKRRGRKRRY